MSILDLESLQCHLVVENSHFVGNRVLDRCCKRQIFFKFKEYLWCVLFLTVPGPTSKTQFVMRECNLEWAWIFTKLFRAQVKWLSYYLQAQLNRMIYEILINYVISPPPEVTRLFYYWNISWQGEPMRWSHSNFVPFNFGMKSASRSQPSILTHSEHCSNSRHTPSSSFSGFKLLSDNSSKNVFKSYFRSLPSNFRSEKRSNWYLRRPKFQAQWHPCSKTDSSEVLISDFFWPAASNDIATIVITLSRIGEKDVNFFGIKWPEINIKLPLTHWKILENSSRNFLKFQFFWSRARPFYWKPHPDMDTVCVTPRIRKILFSTKSFVLNEFSRNRPV